ncbi:MAG: YfbK domain-containing protein, partial [Verrucomicrobiales bacterium]
SLNVSEVGFHLARAALAKGEWPAAEGLRVEEFVNSLDYGDAPASEAERVACAQEQAAHPFLQQRNLLRISLGTAALGRQAGTPLRLTVLLDRSGSMEREDRVASVRAALERLTELLGEGDELSLIGFARTPHLLAARVKGEESGEKVLGLLEATPSEGGTNLESALALGRRVARQQFAAGAQNRVILVTDGAANLGDAKPERLAALVTEMRKEGIAFDACGVGAKGLNDEILESLTRQGDGRYYLLDRAEEADAGFARQIAGALRPAAENVKVQVVFNEKRVGRYQLHGFEKHRLAKEDFRDDAVDAAELAGEENGVALYHFEPLPEGEGEVGTVSVRFRDTASGEMVERLWMIPYLAQPPALFGEAEEKVRLATLAWLAAEKLRGGPAGEALGWGKLQTELARLEGAFGGRRNFREFQEMVRQARALAGETKD